MEIKTPVLLAATALLAVAVPAQDGKAPRQTFDCDPSAILWYKPGEFQAARARALKHKRLLIIKGISFGVDDVGAGCATKGKW